MTIARRILPLLLLLAAALALALWSVAPPAAKPVDAPATDFSAARAMATVRGVAQRPHPSGSAEAAAVRGAIAVRLRALGFAVTRLRGVGIGHSAGSATVTRAGRVEDLVAVRAGRDRALPAVAIMAHTDSVPGSFGAGDDGVGIAVALEVARAIAAGPPPLRDVQLILTDGEEAGLLGAHLFFANAARAARIGALLNIDSRGTSGRGTMFETGPGSGGLVALYRAVGRERSAHSAATFLYRRLPNSTDLTAAKGLDLPALNFAFLEGEYDYHTPRDRIASVDPRTVQSLGDQVLPVVQALAAAPALPPRGEDGVFADAAGIVAVRYPAWVGWPLLVVALVAGAWAVRGASLAPALRVAGATLWIGVATALAARAGYALTGVGDDWIEHHRITAAFARYEVALALLALAGPLAAAAALRRGGMRWPLAMAGGLLGAIALLGGQKPAVVLPLAGLAILLALAGFTRRVGQRELRAGTLGVGLLAALAVQSLAPPLTPVLLWSVLAAALGAAAERRWARGGWIAAVLGLLPLAYLLVFGHFVLVALGVPTPEAVALFALIAAPLLVPLVDRPLGFAAPLLALAGAALLLSFRWTAPTERHPLLSQINGVQANGRSWRVSSMERPDAWTRRALAADGGRIGFGAVPGYAETPLWIAPARPLRLPPPTIRLTRRGDRVALTVTPGSGGRSLRLTLDTDRPLAAATIEGLPAPHLADRAGKATLHWQSPGDPVTLGFRAAPGTRLSLIAAETSERRLALPPRPATVVPFLASDRLIAVARGDWRL